MGISLEKGQRISLEKNGSSLSSVCVGVNWGAIDKKGIFGNKKIAVDLDASIGMYNDNKELIDIVYFGKLKSDDGSINHSGDDLTGDMDGDDGIDNEIITVELNKVPLNVKHVAIVINSYEGHDFAEIPFASVRLYEGSPTVVNNILANYNVSNNSKFTGSVSMILGIFYRINGNWKFKAIGEPIVDEKIEGILETTKSFL